MNSSTVTGGFNILLSEMELTTRQNINNKIEDLNKTTNHLDLIDIYRALCPTTEKCKFFSRVGTFSGIDHMLGHKPSVNKLERTEITESMLFDHNRVKLEINNKEIWEIHKYMEFKQPTLK